MLWSQQHAPLLVQVGMHILTVCAVCMCVGKHCTQTLREFSQQKVHWCLFNSLELLLSTVSVMIFVRTVCPFSNLIKKDQHDGTASVSLRHKQNDQFGLFPFYFLGQEKNTIDPFTGVLVKVSFPLDAILSQFHKQTYMTFSQIDRLKLQQHSTNGKTNREVCTPLCFVYPCWCAMHAALYTLTIYTPIFSDCDYCRHQ